MLGCGPKKNAAQHYVIPTQAQQTDSGLYYEIIKKGNGEQPDATSKVTVHYRGSLTNGEVFDSSYQRGEPSTFELNQVIPGWTEGLQLMQVGATYRFWIPPDLAYKNRAGTPQGILIFEIELLSVTKTPKISSASLSPSLQAQRTSSGLAYEMLIEGSGTEHPNPESIVTVHYSGWLADGTPFDSTITRGQPATFPLDRVITGWTEGLQLMTVGEKTRFWIPPELAYENQPRAPQGILIFDIELISFFNH
ncbi:MAG: peptidylprolyl isomerase [Proteobacteria bacterium]|nr:peptidylprolyl isomerase [Pseudomonadota bacterium]